MKLAQPSQSPGTSVQFKGEYKQRKKEREGREGGERKGERGKEGRWKEGKRQKLKNT